MPVAFTIGRADATFAYMRSLAVLATLIATILGAPWPVQGDQPFYSADKLEQFCRSGNSEDQAVCRGYIVGAADALHGGGATCVPPAITTDRLVEIVLNQMANSDAEVGRPAETEIVKAFNDAFPTPPCL